MPFFLVSASGAVEAQAVARVQCGSGDPLLAAGTWFPLQVGNTWVYRVDSRAGTANYVTWRITWRAEANGQSYYVMGRGGNSVAWRRESADGRVWSAAPGEAEAVLIDPAAQAMAGAVAVPGGTASPASLVRVVRSALSEERQTYARGVGMARSVTNMLTGSSGGFTIGYELVEARLEGGRVRFAADAPKVSLAVERTVLNVSGRAVTNCAIPSYCVACGLIGADPPGTYKPCVQARIEAPPGATAIDVTLRDAAGAVIYRVRRAPNPPAALEYMQIPLYARPNEAFAAGNYVIGCRATLGDGSQSEATLPVRIE